MDHCPYCSFDPTSMNDYCDDHRPTRTNKGGISRRERELLLRESLLVGMEVYDARYGEWYVMTGFDGVKVRFRCTRVEREDKDSFSPGDKRTEFLDAVEKMIDREELIIQDSL